MCLHDWCVYVPCNGLAPHPELASRIGFGPPRPYIGQAGKNG